MGTTRESSKSVNLGRHRRYCKICSHERRDEIEQDFIAWKSPIAIAEEYGLADRMNVYRHANALGLFEKRRAGTSVPHWSASSNGPETWKLLPQR
jgi:hypothetical protein